MKLHVATRSQYGVMIAAQAEQSGATATVYSEHQSGRGLAKFTDAMLPQFVPDALVVDGIGFGQLVEDAEAKGIRTYFGGKWAELMSCDAQFCAAILDSWGYAHKSAPSLDGVVHVGGCWYDGGCKPPFYTGKLYTRLMAGNVGVCAEPVMAVLRPDTKPPDSHLDVQMSDSGYRGPVTVVFDEHHEPCDIALGVQPLVLEALSEMTRGGIAALLAGGKVSTGTDCAVSVRVTTFPWPMPPVNLAVETAFELDGAALRHFWPHNVNMVDGVMTAMDGASIGTITARGRSVEEASRRVERTLQSLRFDGVQYRTDAA